MNIKSGRWYGVFTLLAISLTTVCTFIPIFILGLLKLYPQRVWRLKITKLIDYIINYWISLNNRYINRTQPISWDIQCDNSLDSKNWHLVIANHQSWVDIVVLQKLFARKIPIMKFFIKDSLKWIPFLGFAWWAMGCPFMKRYSKKYLEKKPHKRGKDLVTTQKAMHLFKEAPVSIMNFVEGTRFTPSKKDAQQSPYRHLLKPKAGGISFSVHTLSERITSLLDVTIIYPNQKISFWNFLCRRIRHLKVIVREIPIPPTFLQGTLLHDEAVKISFRDWLNEQWAIKDKLVAEHQNQ